MARGLVMKDGPLHQDSARLDQVLHGYSDGHRLLSASMQIPQSTQRLLLAMSDRSGPGRHEGFESYVTGYPLPEINGYAVGRTWYATEMPRPGCVWTHTLVVSASTLARLSTLDVFEWLFRRPDGPEFDRELYASPLSLKSVRMTREEADGIYLGGIRVPVVEAVLRSLYGSTAGLPVFLLGDTAKQWQQLVFSVWSQQWGGLRSRFSFCTGSVTPRSVADRPLDFQVIPRSRLKEVDRGIGGVVIDPFDVQMGSYPDMNGIEGAEFAGNAWLSATVSDLFRGEGASVFRRRLRRYTVDVPPVRGSFRHVAAFIGSGFRMEPKARLAAAEFLASEYPSPHLASKLKTALLGPPRLRGGTAKESIDEVMTCEDELDRLEILLILRGREAYDPVALHLHERVEAAVKTADTRRELAVRLLGQRRNEWGDRAFAELLGEMRATEIGDIFSWDEGLLGDALRKNPQLVKERAVWEAPSSVQRFVLRTVAATADSDDHVWSGLVSAALDAGADHIASPVRAIIGERAVLYALNWLSTTRRHRLPPDWTWLVVREPEILFEWIASRGGRPIIPICALVSELSPTDRRVLSLDPAPLVAVGQKACKRLARLWDVASGEPFETYASALTTLLAIGLRSADGEHLVRATFSSVHALAKTENLGWKRWRLLSSLGRSSEWAVWDRPSNAEQLERATVTAYVRGGWSPSLFSKTVTDDAAFHRSLQYARNASTEGFQFAKAAWEAWDKQRS